MRLFFGLPIPEALRRQLTEIQESIKASLPAGAYRWTQPALFHVTLAFLGEVAENDVQEVCDRAAEVCQGYAPKSLGFTRFGCFPSETTPRVLWVGCSAENPATAALSKLGSELAQACGRFGDGKPESQIILHVTLARSNRRPSPVTSLQVRQHLESRPTLELAEAPIREAILYQSHLGQGPARYQPIGHFPLNA